MKGTPDTVAKVGKHAIKYREFQQEYERQLQFYSNYMAGGKSLSSEQIKSFGIKENTIRGLVNRKLIVEFADMLEVYPAPEHVKEQIKSFEFFKTNGNFDVNRYKLVLANARLTPSDFEADVSDQIKAERVQNLITNFPVSSAFIKDLVDFKSNLVKVNLVQIEKKALEKHLSVSKSEISTYLADKTNQERVKNIFTSRKSRLDRPEQIKARHILLTTGGKDKKPEEVLKQITKIWKEATVSNFAKLANQYTEDPSGKKKGGELDWFSRGRMVPEFEKVAFETPIGKITAPVKTNYGYHIILVEKKRPALIAKIEEHQDEIAKELIQSDKKEELATLTEKVIDEVKQSMASNKSKMLDNLVAQYSLVKQNDVFINQIDGTTGRIALKTDQLAGVFEAPSSQNVVQINDILSTILVQKLAITEKEKKEHEIKPADEKVAYVTSLSRKFQTDLIKNLETQVKVQVYDNLR